MGRSRGSRLMLRLTPRSPVARHKPALLASVGPKLPAAEPITVFTEEAAVHVSTADGLFPVVSSLTLSVGFTRLWVLTEPLLKGTALLPVDKLALVLLSFSCALSAYATTYSLLARYYAELSLAVTSQQDKAAVLAAMSRPIFVEMRRFARNALWASLLLLIAPVFCRIASLSACRLAPTACIVSAVVLGVGMVGIVATVRTFRRAYVPLLAKDQKYYQQSMPMDTTGDGKNDSLGVDTTGDGKIDTVVPKNDGRSSD